MPGSKWNQLHKRRYPFAAGRHRDLSGNAFYPISNPTCARFRRLCTTSWNRSVTIHFTHVRDITPAMRLALQQLIDCPYGGMTRKLFFESRALELIAHQLYQMPGPEPPLPASVKHRLHPGDPKAYRAGQRPLDQQPGKPSGPQRAGPGRPACPIPS